MADMLVDEQFDRRLMFNQKTTALLIGISTQAFSKWGVPPSERRGRESFYYWPEIQAERDRRQLPAAGEAGGLDLKHESAREHRARADKIELENAEARGELIRTSDMAEVLGKALTAVRARLLAAASKLAPLVNPGNPNLARDLIEREHLEVLAELADFDPDGEQGELPPNRNGAVRDTAPAAKANDKPVVRRRKKTQ